MRFCRLLLWSILFCLVSSAAQAQEYIRFPGGIGIFEKPSGLTMEGQEETNSISFKVSSPEFDSGFTFSIGEFEPLDIPPENMNKFAILYKESLISSGLIVESMSQTQVGGFPSIRCLFRSRNRETVHDSVMILHPKSRLLCVSGTYANDAKAIGHQTSLIEAIIRTARFR